MRSRGETPGRGEGGHSCALSALRRPANAISVPANASCRQGQRRRAAAGVRRLGSCAPARRLRVAVPSSRVVADSTAAAHERPPHTRASRRPPRCSATRGQSAGGRDAVTRAVWVFPLRAVRPAENSEASRRAKPASQRGANVRVSTRGEDAGRDWSAARGRESTAEAHVCRRSPCRRAAGIPTPPFSGVSPATSDVRKTGRLADGSRPGT